MRARVVAITNESENVNKSDIMTFSGKLAGICYMPSDYDSLNSDVEGAQKRIRGCMKSGHHSVIEHCYVTVVFEGVSKIFAMLLNSIQAYNTSEKSGRYTVMQNAEGNLYGKWLNIFKELYIEDLKERGLKQEKINLMATKFAQDSARGVIDVTIPNTIFAYTTSMRMWNYIRDWAVAFISKYNAMEDSAVAMHIKGVLNKELQELVEYIDKEIKVENLDNDFREFDFITNYSGISCEYEKLGSNYQNWGVQYLVTYKASFVEVAQAERHRTIKYYMTLPKDSDVTYTVPNIIKDTDYEAQWLADLTTVIAPQAMQVVLIEQGNIDNFVLKCRERICGAAHEEIREQTVRLLQDYYVYSLSDCKEAPICWIKLHGLFNDTTSMEPKVKCSKGYKCTKPCVYKQDIESLIYLK